jgi:GT2 family glycosyltransferase
MKVSVASTSFNQKESLKKLYNSLIANKDYLDVWSLWEDGSTDGSVEMIKEWELKKEIPIIVNYNTTKSGMGIRQNWAIKQCKDLFILIFGDSYIDPDGLKKLSETYIDGTAGSGYRFDVDPNGSFIRNDFRFEPNDKITSVMENKEPWQWVCGNGYIGRKKDLEDIGWMDETYKGYGHDDYDWFMRLMMNGVKLYAYNNIKVYHLDHPISPISEPSKELYNRKMSK